MKKIAISVTLLLLILVSVFNLLKPKERAESKLVQLREKVTQKAKYPADHSKYEILRQAFATPQEVTKACISCHTSEAKEIMHSNHWQWERPEYIKDRGVVYLGKKNAINNFCIGIEGSEKSCAKCHIGFGMESEKTFNYNDSTNIDCLVCHDNTDTYLKASEKGGRPVDTLDFANIAQHVGKPTRANCGVCHFFGGGGNNVKHGDLEKAMFEPGREVDVHMASDGANLQCVDCHKTSDHNISGKMYSLSSMNRNRVLCEDCHSGMPHQDEILNKHGIKVACQSCHIPEIAKVNATKTYWDWSTAGKLKDGKPFEIDDKDGNHVYLSIKGTFVWGKNLEPEYTWFNGTANHYLLGDKVEDTTMLLELNTLNGGYDIKESKIIPLKIHIANQPFDPVNKILIQPKLFSEDTGKGAFWKDFNWKTASKAGMKEVGLPFSGEVGFIRTTMNWPVNHMVSTKDKALKCEDCHTSVNSRLKDVKGFYMPARDSSPFIEKAGLGLISVSFLFVLIHGIFRILSGIKMKKEGK